MVGNILRTPNTRPGAAWNLTENTQMKGYAKSYAIYLAMAVLTAVVIVPMAKNANIPFIKDL